MCEFGLEFLRSYFGSSVTRGAGIKNSMDTTVGGENHCGELFKVPTVSQELSLTAHLLRKNFRLPNLEGRQICFLPRVPSNLVMPHYRGLNKYISLYPALFIETWGTNGHVLKAPAAQTVGCCSGPRWQRCQKIMCKFYKRPILLKTAETQTMKFWANSNFLACQVLMDKGKLAHLLPRQISSRFFSPNTHGQIPST